MALAARERTVKATFQKVGPWLYQGVIRDSRGGPVVWACEHRHVYAVSLYVSHGTISALACARQQLSRLEKLERSSR